MKIVILGAGQVGRTAAHHLSREEANEVTVVDVDEEILRDLQDRLTSVLSPETRPTLRCWRRQAPLKLTSSSR